MGAYSNPQVIVDTQTGQHFRDLQQSIASSFSSYAQSEIARSKEFEKKREENAKKIEELNKQAEEYEFTLRTEVGKLNEGDDKLNIAETFEPLIQEAVKLKSGLLNNTITGKDRQAAMQKLADINGSVTGNFSTSLADMSAYAGDLDKLLLLPVGSPGGLSKSMPADDVDALRIMQGKLKGTKKAVYKDNDPKKLVWEIYKNVDGKDVLVKSYDAANLKKINDLGAEFIQRVPDTTAKNEAIKANVPGLFETEPVDKRDPNSARQANGRIAEKFLFPEEKVEIGEKGSGVYKLVRKPKMEEIKKDPTLAAQLNSTIAGMTDDELMLHTVNTVNGYLRDTNQAAVCVDSDTPLTPTEKAESIAAYKEWWYATQIGKGQDVLKEDGDVYVFEDEKKSSGKTGGSAGSDNRPTEAEKNNKAAIDNLYNQKAGRKGDYEAYGRKVHFDGKVWRYGGGGGKDEQITVKDEKGKIRAATKQEIANYLKNGTPGI